MRNNRMWIFLLLFFCTSSLFAHVIMPEFTLWFLVRNFAWFGFQYVFTYGFYHILLICILFFVAQPLKSVIQHIVFFIFVSFLSALLSASNGTVVFFQYIEIIIVLSVILLGIENSILIKIPKYRLITIVFFGVVHGLGFAYAFGKLYSPFLFHSADSHMSIFVYALAFIVGVELVLLGVSIVLCLGMILIHNPVWHKKIVIRYTNIGIVILGLVLLVKMLL